jgi:hypothetical protein
VKILPVEDVELIVEGFLEMGDICGVSDLFWTGLSSLIF